MAARRYVEVSKVVGSDQSRTSIIVERCQPCDEWKECSGIDFEVNIPTESIDSALR